MLGLAVRVEDATAAARSAGNGILPFEEWQKAVAEFDRRHPELADLQYVI